MARKGLRGCIVALATAVAAILAGPASAVHYSSGYDPTVFSGTGLFQFDDACLASDGVFSGASAHATLLSNVTDITSPGTGHLNFAPVLPNSVDIVDIVIVGGTLVAVDTNLIGPVFAAPCTDGACGVPWWVEWVSNVDFPSVDPQVELFTGGCFEGCSPDSTPSGTAMTVTFTRVSVPEPGTLGLLIGAIGAGWFVRRRKRSA